MSDEQPPLQEDAVSEVGVPEQATYEVLLVDRQNPGYEDLPDDIADEANKDEFEESDVPDDGSFDE